MAIIRVKDDFPTIQDAVDNARVGDKIIVEKGIYNESVTVKKNFIGINAEDDDVVIDGNFVENIGFSLDNVEGVVIKGFIISRFLVNGILVNGGGFHRLVENTITQISKDFSGDGISILFSSGNLLWQNRVSVGEFGFNGISIFFSDGNRLIENKLRENGASGVLVFGSNNVLIKNNISDNFYGFPGVLDFGANTLMYDNKIFDNSEQGIFTLAGNHIVILRNDIDDNGAAGIFLFVTKNSIIGKNEIEENQGSGIEVFVSDYNTIHKNEIEENGDDGINVSSGSEQNLISKNKLRKNMYFDIDLNDPDNNLIDNECKRTDPPGLGND